MGFSFSRKSRKPTYSLQSINTIYGTTKELSVEPIVLIIGAGAAGLACAYELRRHGFQMVTILEQSNRIGGRILTMGFADNYVDLGAEFIHGEKDNIVYQMVKGRNLIQSSSTNDMEKLEWIQSNGVALPRPTLQLLMDALNFIFQNRKDELYEYRGSFGDYLHAKFLIELKKPEYAGIDKDIAMNMLRTFQKMEGACIDAGMEQLSGAGFESFEPCEGDRLLNFGYKGFVQFLYQLTNGNEMNETGDFKDDIIFNSCVRQIIWDRLDGSVQVECEHDTYVADHVVITVSLGVLKKCPWMFSPRLPEKKRRAINFIGFGYLCKIFLEFEIPFWSTDWKGFNTVWTTEDLDRLKLTNLFWITDIYGFYTVAHQPRVIQVWASGMHVEYIETLEKPQLTDGLLTTLSKFIPTVNIPRPVRVITSKWTIDGGYIGAYSYPTVLTEQFQTCASDLSQPVSVLTHHARRNFDESVGPRTISPILLFAGEATSPTHFSTVHGAVESGIREARRLAGYHFKEVSDNFSNL